MVKLGALLLAMTFVVASCGSPDETPPSTADTTGSGVTDVREQPAVVRTAPRDQAVVAAAETGFAPLLAVGDIASCDVKSDDQVAKLAADRTGRIAILGDAVYPHGSAKYFNQCFDPSWGPMASRLRPSLGNHEYHSSATAQPYFDYFGDYSGQPGKGWYSYSLGQYWRVIVLNSNCARIGGCTMDSPQGRWLTQAIDNAGDRHIVAYWHHPLYSSGNHGPNPSVRPFYRALYRHGAALVLNGHDHHYERFAPQNASGDVRANGIQQFIVGTGGATHYAIEDVMPNSKVRNSTSFGLLKLRLKATGYSWSFIRSTGSFTDSGSRTLN